MTEITREELDDRALKALDLLSLSTGMNLSAERKAAILVSLRGSGVTIVQVETACRQLARSTEFADKLRYGGTIAPSDILELARVAEQGLDPLRALYNREQRMARMTIGRKELPPADRE